MYIKDSRAFLLKEIDRILTKEYGLKPFRTGSGTGTFNYSRPLSSTIDLHVGGSVRNNLDRIHLNVTAAVGGKIIAETASGEVRVDGVVINLDTYLKPALKRLAVALRKLGTEVE